MHAYASSSPRPVFDAAARQTRAHGWPPADARRKNAAQTAYSDGVDFRLLVDNLAHIVWIIGSSGVTEYLNTRGAEYAGAAGHVGSTPDWAALIHPDDHTTVGLAWAAAAGALAPLEVECRLRRWDGEYRWHTVRAHPRHSCPDSAVTWIGTATDIDTAKALENSLRAAEQEAAETVALLETLQSNAPVGFGFVDRDFRRVRVNGVLAGFNGSTVDEQIGRLLPDVVPLLWPTIEPNYRHVLDTGEPVLDVEVAGPVADDPLARGAWMVSLFPVDVHGAIVGVGVVATDVTSQREVDHARRLLSAIVEGSDSAIFALTRDGCMTTWNGGSERLFGYTAAEAIGASVLLITPNRYADEVRRARHRLLAGGPAEHHDSQLQRKDGSLVDVHFIASPITDEAGTMVGLSVIVEDITDRVIAQRQLLASQRQLAEAQQIAGVGSFEFDLAVDELTWSQEMYRILGIDPTVTPSTELFLSLIHPDDRSAVFEGWTHVTEHGGGDIPTHRVMRPDKTEAWVEGAIATNHTEDGRVTRVAGTLRDITERVRLTQAQKAADIRIAAGFEQGGIGAAILDLKAVPTRVNAAACELMGRSETDLVGRSWTKFMHPDDRALVTEMAARLAAGHDSFADERRYLRPDGSVVWAAVHITLVRDDLGRPAYFLAQIQDICLRKKMEDDLRHQARHDGLTGLPNRVLLTERLTDGLARTRARGVELAVLFLDVDNIKAVNDTLGHRAGDDLLIHVAARIAETIRHDDTLARFGGDSFAIVCEDASADAAGRLAERVRSAVRKPYRIGVHELQVTASFGIALADRAATPDSLLSDADAAMYVAKGRGKDRVEVFNTELRANAEARLDTTHALRHALGRDELFVQYQPVIDLQSGAMVSAEALLRWRHPQRGLVSPADFIPVAEDTGLIIQIGAWVLEQSCRQLVEWQRHDPAMSIAVNLSVKQLLATDIIDVIADILSRTGAPAAGVCIELTESVLMEDPEYFGAKLAGIKALGVSLSIDDFGTGYSSLSYLKQFPVDCVKIDRSFVNGLGVDPDDSTLVIAILAMADALKLTVTAEGIENEHQLGILSGLNCDRAQGFLLARPTSADAVSALLRDAHRWPVGTARPA